MLGVGQSKCERFQLAMAFSIIVMASCNREAVLTVVTMDATSDAAARVDNDSLDLGNDAFDARESTLGDDVRDAGTFRDGGLPEDRGRDVSTADVYRVPLPPRLIAPYSQARTTSQRPTLRWELPQGMTRARVELCRDRGCAQLHARLEVSGNSIRPATALPRGVMFWRVHGLDASGVVRWTSHTWQFRVPVRDTGRDTAWGLPSDFNGDGYDDLGVGSTYQVAPVGIYTELRMYWGSAAGLGADRQNSLRFSDGILYIIEPMYCDIDNDGLSDQVVLHSSTKTMNARLSFVRGNRLGRLVTEQAVDIPLETSGDIFWGQSVGDLDGDGFCDVVLREGLSRRLTVYWGDPRGIGARVVIAAGDFVRYLFRPVVAGDIDGDGYADLVSFRFYIPGHRGEILAMRGRPRGTRLEFDLGSISGAPDVHFQNSYSGIVAMGDYNADGAADVLAASLGALTPFAGQQSGSLLLAQTPITSPDPNSTPNVDCSFPSAHIATGDFDGNGIVDVTAGARCSTPLQAGRLFFFRGSMNGLEGRPYRQVEGNTQDGQLGTGVVSPGDVNGDGFDDFAAWNRRDIDIRIENYPTTTVWVFHGSASGLPGRTDVRLPFPDTATIGHDRFTFSATLVQELGS